MEIKKLILEEDKMYKEFKKKDTKSFKEKKEIIKKLLS